MIKEKEEGLQSFPQITAPHELIQSWSSHRPKVPIIAVQSFEVVQLLPHGDLGAPADHGAVPAFGCFCELMFLFYKTYFNWEK